MPAYLQIPQFTKSFTFITAFSFIFFPGQKVWQGITFLFHKGMCSNRLDFTKKMLILSWGF